MAEKILGSSEKIEVVFSTKDPKRHSVRWDSNEKDTPVDAIYINKPYFEGAKKIKITIEEVK